MVFIILQLVSKRKINYKNHKAFSGQMTGNVGQGFTKEVPLELALAVMKSSRELEPQSHIYKNISIQFYIPEKKKTICSYRTFRNLALKLVNIELSCTF